MNLIENKTFDEERALYNSKDTIIRSCTFAGERDGESVLKESRNIIVDNCSFSLRYPLWHTEKFELINSKLDELTREVREHNNFAKRMPVVEEQIKVINHRINDLERKEEQP